MALKRVLILQEDSMWVVQGIEHDIVAQGKTIDSAMYFFARQSIERLMQMFQLERFRCLELAKLLLNLNRDMKRQLKSSGLAIITLLFLMLGFAHD
jgi:hypothetical protein